MGRSMKGFGLMIERMGREGSCMREEIFILETGKMIRHMGKERTYILMERGMKEAGFKTNSMGKGRRYKQINHLILGNL